jgi:hypothetical protein
LIVAFGALDRDDFGERKYFHPGVLLDALVLNLQPARRRTEFGEIFVELCHASAQKWPLFHEVNLMAHLGGFQGGGDSAESASDDENAAVLHVGPPRDALPNEALIKMA